MSDAGAGHGEQRYRRKTLQRFRLLNESKDADQIRVMGRFAACGFNDALNLPVKPPGK
jgi:hypothetical protein